MARNNQSAFNFDKALDKLSHIVEKMERGDLSLEQSLTTFEQGIKLTHDCHSALKETEQKVQILIEQNIDSELIDYDSLDDLTEEDDD